ncbi:M48 family metallopeptidase [Mariprofundus erugo]|uniref:M48 family metallopeptidase n=1 Tax=Mariprofundus erugo TaxID=2528639 RepID=A0A5R9GTM7_9PROT|nr:SprT family zinc-dependent metalloprotease [Mariprofundus erugo]TLS67607.1 M48 family metallopeptidase [Mariprofundus erugo]
MNGLSYQIVRRPRRTTTSIVIHPDNRIEVLAPPGAPLSSIHSWVQSKKSWIERKLHFNSHVRTQASPQRFHAGASFTLLDQPFLLRIVEGKRRARITFDQQEISAHLPAAAEADEHTLRPLLTAWYKRQAGEYMRQRVAHYAGITGYTPSLVGIKSYRSRWGSCHTDGRIYFNWRLIMAPAAVVDYVIVHELCHLPHPNHSRAFWQQVERFCPDYRDARNWLKVHGLSLDL